MNNNIVEDKDREAIQENTQTSPDLFDGELTDDDMAAISAAIAADNKAAQNKAAAQDKAAQDKAAQAAPAPAAQAAPAQNTAGNGGYKAPLLDDVVADALDYYFQMNKITQDVLLDRHEARQAAVDMMNEIVFRIKLENKVVPKGEKGLPVPTALPKEAVVRAILETDEVKLLRIKGAREDILIVKEYDKDGFTGIWKMAHGKEAEGSPVWAMIYNLLGEGASISTVNSIMAAIRKVMTNTQLAYKYVRKDGWRNTLIPFYNGVFDGKTHTFTAWNDPDYEKKYGSITFTNKLDTCYNPAAQCPAYFDPVKFIYSLCDNTKKGRASARILLRIVQFALRRYNGREGRLIFLNNVQARAAGHNGKSTFMQLIAFLIEHGALNDYDEDENTKTFSSNGSKVITAHIDTWGKDFMIGDNIRGAWLLMSDENSGANFIDKTGFLKNVARRQPNLYNNKYDKPFSYVFPGIAIHAQNDYVQFATKDDAGFTHRLDISFEMDFTNGDPNIKTKYIMDEAVAEYLVKYVCDMDFADDYDPEDVAELAENTEDVRRANIPTFQFFDEVLLDGFWLSVLPVKVLYMVYLSWCSANLYTALTPKKFENDLVSWMSKHKDKFEYVRTRNKMKKDDLQAACSNTHQALLEYGRGKDGKAIKYVATKNDMPYGEIIGCFDWKQLEKMQFQAFIVFKDYGKPAAAAPVDDTKAAAAPADDTEKSEPWICPECGSIVPGRHKYCGTCGAYRPDADHPWICPTCKTKVHGDHETCGSCGYTRQWICPECGAKVPGGLKVCQSCGGHIPW